MTKILFLIGVCLALSVEAKQSNQGTELIKQKMIQQSIADYSGSCPCPYNTARNGSRCGKRSAYSRQGGDAPLCYPEDVTDHMLKAYKQRT